LDLSESLPTVFVAREEAASGSKKKDAALLNALERLMQDATAGDPMKELKWTHKSLRKLCRTLRRQGFRIGRQTIARLLREQRFLLRTNRKCQAGTHHPDRNRQFRYLAQQRRRFLKKGWPVLRICKRITWHFRVMAVWTKSRVSPICS
jgi:hypothetical protein